MNRTTRFLVFASLAVTAATVAPTAHATGGVLAPSSGGDPSTLDIQVAVTKVAGSPPSATRWSRITVGGVSSVMWLVPVRPGAAVDYSNDAWLDALDETTAPRVGPREKPADCDVKKDVERVETWGAVGVKKYPKNVTVLETEADARAHAAAFDYRMTVEAGGRLHDAYTKGWSFVAFEIVTPTTGGLLASSPIVRVRDDGGLVPGGAEGMVPLALTGSTAVVARVTAWVLGDGAADLPNTRDVDSSAIVWTETGSTFAKNRAGILGGSGATWLREAATHDAFFSELLLPKASPLPPLYAVYFAGASGGPRTGCEAATLTASGAMGTVRRTCNAGAVANVPGGAACAPGNGAIDPAAFTCGQGIDDLALALANVSPSKIVATRFAGVVGKSAFGTDLAISSSTATVSPLHDASRTECTGATKPPSSSSSSSSSGQPGGPPIGTPGGGGGGGSSGGGHSYWRRTDSCSGSSVVFVDNSGGQQVVSDDTGCGGSTETTSTGGGGSSTSGGSSSGWDTDDNSSVSSSSSSSGSSSSSSSSDDCGGDSTSSSSSDSCDCGSGSTSSSSSDSCDCGGSGSSSASDSCDSGSSGADSCDSGSGSSSGCGKGCDSSAGAGISPGTNEKRLFPKARVTKNGRVVKASSGGRSPVSRYALFFIALALPLRRRLRNTTWKW